MTNALFKAARQRVELPDPVPPPQPPQRRLVRRTGIRPKYEFTQWILIGFGVGGKPFFEGVDATKVRTGFEPYDYYEWVVDEVDIPQPRQPVVTPVPPAWDATARSGLVATDPMVVEWTVGRGNEDIIVGLSTTLQELDAAALAQSAGGQAALRATVLHGFRIIKGAAYVHAAPPPEFGTVGMDVRYSSWPIENGSLCRIECTRGVVRYMIDGTVIATGPAFVHHGQAIYLRAVLYGTGDSVENPALLQTTAGGEGEAIIGPLTARGGRYAEGRAMIGPLWVQGPDHRRGVAVLGPLWARGRSTEAGGSGVAQLAPLAAWGWGLQLNSGQGSAMLAPLVAKGASNGYSDGVAMLGPLWVRARGEELPPGNNAVTGLRSLWDAQRAPGTFGGAYAQAQCDVTFSAQLRSPRSMKAKVGVRTRAKMSRVWAGRLAAAAGIRASARGERVLDVLLVTEAGIDAAPVGLFIVTAEMHASVGIGGLLTSARLAEAQLRSALGIGAATGATGEYAALLRAMVAAGVTGMRDAGDYLVWSVERGGASAGYENFPFNSFARIGGRIFAAADTGLYELAGDTDAGMPIRAWADLGQRNFGSPMLKGISNAYLTASSDSPLIVQVTTPEGRTYCYRARGAGPMQAQRVDFGRGLRATYLNLEIMNDGGGDFDLERLEFVVNASTNRRI
ncbi:structural protein [Acidovorax phage AP1]|nr:structural protein [Acidovorax phage AP1]